MGKERNEEQEFLENIERFLDGEDITSDKDSSEDVRSNMEFAKKLSELRAEPSLEFRESLKSSLLRRLTEQEITARERAGVGWFGGFWNGLVPQSPVWRTAAVTVAIVVVAVGVMWRTGLFSMTSAPAVDGEMLSESDRGLEETTTDDAQKYWNGNGLTISGEQEEEDAYAAPPSVAEDSVLNVEIEISSSNEVTVIIEPLTTQYGAEITLALTFVNNSAETVTIDPIKPEIVVKNSDGEEIYTLLAVDGPGELQPLESFQMLYVWEQEDGSGAQIPAGTYQFYIGAILLTWGSNSGEITPPSAAVVVLELE